MADDSRILKHTYTTETSVDVALGFMEFLKGIRESGANLLSKHLDNEAAKIRIRELELQVELARDSKKSSGPRPVG
jgi:hypothetical protein